MKLLNINTGIKIDNSTKIASLIQQQNPDFVVMQEVVRHLDEKVFTMYKSKHIIDKILSNTYPYSFFGPLWITNAYSKNGKMHRDFGGFIEQSIQNLPQQVKLLNKDIIITVLLQYCNSTVFVTMKC